MKSKAALHKVLPLSAVPDSHANKPVKKHHKGPKTKRQKITCKVFWGAYRVQTAEILKTAMAIIVALMWSTTVSSMFDAMFASYFTYEEYKVMTLTVGFATMSILIAALVPVIAFKYVQPDDYWAVVILIEILGHLWGFKIKDLIVYFSYNLHYLYQVYHEQSVANVETEYEFCNLVAPQFVFATNDVSVDSANLGWEGYNLDWTEYTRNRSIFENYYNYTAAAAPGPAPLVVATNASSRRELQPVVRNVPSPSPYTGPRTDLSAADAVLRGPGRTCNFEYRKTTVLKGFRVEKVPRPVYFAELGSRILIWASCLCICVVFVVIIRAIYNKLIFPNCCKKSLTHEAKHNWEHMQNHLIADAWANGMGWVSAWFFWWLTILIIHVLSNLTETSPCNGMHAFPLASVVAGLGMFFVLVAMLLYLRIHIWARMLVCCKGIKQWLGGLGELQNGFMLGWFLIAWVEYFHATFISPYIEVGFEDYSPFDDIYPTYHAATVVLAIEELGEALMWTAFGLLHLTSQKLQIKASHRETTLLKEAKRRLQNYFALTRTFATTLTANEITKLVDERKQRARLMEKRALIEARAVGIWMGLTIELAIHIFISLIENTIIINYQSSGGSGANATSGAYDYQSAAVERSIVFGVNLMVSAALTGFLYAVMYCSHHMSWRISTEKERLMAVRMQKIFRGFRLRHKPHMLFRKSVSVATRKAASTAGEVEDAKRAEDDPHKKKLGQRHLSMKMESVGSP